MLAWVHQTTASEHEFLVALFGVQEGMRMVGSVRDVKARPEVKRKVDEEDGDEEGVEEDGVEGKDVEDMLRECLDKDLEGLGRPLKVGLREFL